MATKQDRTVQSYVFEVGQPCPVRFGDVGSLTALFGAPQRVVWAFSSACST
jgi:hypothetical protein